jgi:hypothetical protein
MQHKYEVFNILYNYNVPMEQLYDNILYFL